jgi:peptidoglycan/xylan/chitin deacetylase (PgdA/CDA1 family)
MNIHSLAKTILIIIFILFLPKLSFTSDDPVLKDKSIADYQKKEPAAWGDDLPLIKKRLKTNDKVIALTFDACGIKNDGFDKKLIDVLIETKTPATLFISGLWIEQNQDAFLSLARNDLFDIENHGWRHKPLSVNGKSALGVEGTKSVQEITDEIINNKDIILKLTGKQTRYFRSGTAYYDDIALTIARDLGYEAIGYRIKADVKVRDDEFTNEITKAFLVVRPGDIILFHMNHPEKRIAPTVKEAILSLKAKGYRFVRLYDYELE